MTSSRAFRLWLLVPVASLLFASASSAVVNIDWVTVGDAGNSCDTQTAGCFGTVMVEYRIGRYEVSNAQYTEFLTAVAATDTNGLYSPFGLTILCALIGLAGVRRSSWAARACTRPCLPGRFSGGGAELESRGDQSGTARRAGGLVKAPIGGLRPDEEG